MFGEFEVLMLNGCVFVDDVEVLDGIEGFDVVVVAEMGLECVMCVNEVCR